MCDIREDAKSAKWTVKLLQLCLARRRGLWGKIAGVTAMEVALLSKAEPEGSNFAKAQGRKIATRKLLLLEWCMSMIEGTMSMMTGQLTEPSEETGVRRPLLYNDDHSYF